MPKFLIDLTLCFAKGENLAHGGGEYGKDAARFLAENLSGFDFLGLVRTGQSAAAAEELGDGVPLREVGSGPLRQLPPDLDAPENILFLPLAGRFLEGGGAEPRARLVVVEHGFRDFEKAYGITDHLCHPLLNRGIGKGLACAYAGFLQGKRIKHATARLRRRLGAVRDRDWVVTPSRHSQFALALELDRIAPGRVDAFRERMGRLPPLSPFSWQGEPPGEEERRGVLVLSANRPVKNAEGLLTGIARHGPSRAAANREGIDLVGVGKASRRRLERRFGGVLTLRFHPYLAPDRLQAFIGRARVLAFPSLAEGYGIPPVQAFRWGTPVLGSAVTAVPEVVGGAALLADPLQPTEMANRLLQLLEDAELWQAKSEAGRHRYEELKRDAYTRWEHFLRELEPMAEQVTAQ